MLIQLQEDPGVRSFAQLYWHTTQQLLLPHRRNPNRTIVLGPITASSKEETDKNLQALGRKARMLAEADWVVLDLTSYQSVVDRIIADNGISGYPFAILEDFTLPLIREAWFSVLWFRSPFSHSIGAMREYEEAVKYGIEIRHFS
jgi:hypothetical protein